MSVPQRPANKSVFVLVVSRYQQGRAVSWDTRLLGRRHPATAAIMRATPGRRTKRRRLRLPLFLSILPRNGFQTVEVSNERVFIFSCLEFLPNVISRMSSVIVGHFIFLLISLNLFMYNVNVGSHQIHQKQLVHCVNRSTATDKLTEKGFFLTKEDAQLPLFRAWGNIKAGEYLMQNDMWRSYDRLIEWIGQFLHNLTSINWLWVRKSGPAQSAWRRREACCCPKLKPSEFSVHFSVSIFLQIRRTPKSGKISKIT